MHAHAQVHKRGQHRQRQPDREVTNESEVDVAQNRPHRAHRDKRGRRYRFRRGQGRHVSGTVPRRESVSFKYIEALFSAVSLVHALHRAFTLNACRRFTSSTSVAERPAPMARRSANACAPPDLARRKPSEADVVIVNTCSVTAEADRSARAFIRRTHRANPDSPHRRHRLLRAACPSGTRQHPGCFCRCRKQPQSLRSRDFLAARRRASLVNRCAALELCQHRLSPRARHQRVILFPSGPTTASPIRSLKKRSCCPARKRVPI